MSYVSPPRVWNEIPENQSPLASIHNLHRIGWLSSIFSEEISICEMKLNSTYKLDSDKERGFLVFL